VAALDPDNPLQLTSYSQACGIAMNYCLAAPGNVVFIDPAARVGDAGYDLYRGGGTSYAAPQVSGAAAVVWSAFPYFTNDLVRQTLLGTARDLGAPGVDPEFGWGLLDVSRAANGPGNFAWGDVSVSFSGHSVWRNEIVGAGGLIKSGSGVLTLLNYQSYTGDTRVQQGGLDIRYGLSSNLSIAQGATVWARGSLNGNVANSGLFLNGAENEAWIVNGHSFTQTATGNLGVWLGSPLRVGGAANLNGQVSVLGVKSGYVTQARETLLTAFGGVNGTFSSLKGAPNVFLQASLAYDPNNVFLDIARIDVSRAVAALGLPMPTQASAVRVEAAMSAIDGQLAGQAPAGIGQDFIDAAGRLQQAASVAEADASLRSLSGELHAVADAMTYDVIAAGRRALGVHAAGRAAGGRAGQDWYQALGAPGQGALGIARYRADGWMLGSEGRLGAHGFAGMAFGETLAAGGVQGGRDRGRDRQTQAMLYAGAELDGVHVVGLLGSGRFDRRIDRGLWLGEQVQGVASGHAGRYFTASVEAGRRLGGDDAWLAPYAGAEYVRLASACRRWPACARNAHGGTRRSGRWPCTRMRNGNGHWTRKASRWMPASSERTVGRRWRPWTGAAGCWAPPWNGCRGKPRRFPSAMTGATTAAMATTASGLRGCGSGSEETAKGWPASPVLGRRAEKRSMACMATPGGSSRSGCAKPSRRVRVAMPLLDQPRSGPAQQAVHSDDLRGNAARANHPRPSNNSRPMSMRRISLVPLM